MMAKKKRKKIVFPKIFHAHALATGFFVVAYVALSVIYGPEFLLSDMRAKYQAVADEMMRVSARVLGPPQKPIVSVNTTCTKDMLAIKLDWRDDESSEYFDIKRNDIPLAMGIPNSEYLDESVFTKTPYKYVVVARGLMEPGYAESEPINVTMPPGCERLHPKPSVKVTAISGGSIDKRGKWSTYHKRPTFFGTTSIANANIKLKLNSKKTIYAELEANENGFWSWKPSADVSKEDHVLYMTATDPLDANKSVFNTFYFTAIDRENGEKKKVNEMENFKTDIMKVVTSNVVNPNNQIATADYTERDYQNSLNLESNLPFKIDTVVKNDKVYQGKELVTSLSISHLKDDVKEKKALLFVAIKDDQGKEINLSSNEITLSPDGNYLQIDKVPLSLNKGEYKVYFEVKYDQNIISQEKKIVVEELPVLKLGGGFTVTYHELLSKMGTISIWMLIASLIWLAFLTREYWLSAHALRQITEESLRSMGMVPSRVNKGKV